MEAAYSAIALALSTNCPAGYSVATLSARMSDGFSDQEAWCEVDGVKVQPDIPTMEGWNASKALHEIRKQMTIPGQAPWSRCTFTLFPDGKFKFDVEYDD